MLLQCDLAVKIFVQESSLWRSQTQSSLWRSSLVAVLAIHLHIVVLFERMRKALPTSKTYKQKIHFRTIFQFLSLHFSPELRPQNCIKRSNNLAVKFDFHGKFREILGRFQTEIFNTRNQSGIDSSVIFSTEGSSNLAAISYITMRKLPVSIYWRAN